MLLEKLRLEVDEALAVKLAPQSVFLFFVNGMLKLIGFCDFCGFHYFPLVVVVSTSENGVFGCFWDTSGNPSQTFQRFLGLLGSTVCQERDLAAASAPYWPQDGIPICAKMPNFLFFLEETNNKRNI